MKEKIKELFKNILIVLLLANILLLTLMALPSNLTEKFPLQALWEQNPILPHNGPLPSNTVERHTAAAKPTLISLRHSAGQASIRRNPSLLEESYDRFSPFLQEALCSASDGSAFAGGWEILSAPGVLFSYDGKIPAQALCQWLEGGDGMVEGYWQQYFLYCDGGEVKLCTVAKESAMRFSTTVSVQKLLELLNTYTPDGSRFAALREDTALSPLTLWETDVTLGGYTASSPVTEQFAPTLASALDFNPYGAGIYTDDSGKTVCTEGERVLTIDPNGSITLQAYAADYSRFTAVSPKPADLIDVAQELLNAVCGGKTGLAQVQLSDFETDGEDSTLTYRYFLDGTPVYPACATVHFRGTVLAEAGVSLCSFAENSSQSFTLMPLSQAAAISEAGAYLFPAYNLSPGGSLSAGWCAR